MGPLAEPTQPCTTTATLAIFSVADCEPPPLDALMVTAEGVVTAFVDTVNVAVVAPAATVTPEGTVASGLLEESVTVVPLEGAAEASVTVPVVVAVPITPLGLTVTEATAGEVLVEVEVEVLLLALLLPPPPQLTRMPRAASVSMLITMAAVFRFLRLRAAAAVPPQNTTALMPVQASDHGACNGG